MRKYKKGQRRMAVLGMILLVAAAYVISNQWFQLILIQGESMHPSYHHLQPAVLDKRVRDYQAGEVVAFQCRGLRATLVKRIAACPGDQVWITDGTLFVNGEISQIYQERGMFAYAGIAAVQRRLRKGEYFVLGDQVAVSRDSRYEEVGTVKEDAILGRVIGSNKGG